MSKPKVSAIVITHLNENQEYLDLCLESLRRQRDVDLEVIVASSCLEPSRVHDSVRLFHLESTITGPQATNFAYSKTRPESQYIFHANDDLILSQDAIAEMCHAAQDNDVIVNPFSNCDMGWMYGGEIDLKNSAGSRLAVQRFMRLPEVRGYEEAIITHPAGYRIYLNFSQLCTYATLIPRKTWERLSGYNTRFIMGYADTDLSFRARKAGIPLMVCFSSFIFHFGGVTTSGNLKQEIRDQDKRLFESLWKGDPIAQGYDFSQ